MPHIDEHRSSSRFSVLARPRSPGAPALPQIRDAVALIDQPFDHQHHQRQRRQPAPELLPADPLAALSAGLVAFRFKGCGLAFEDFKRVAHCAGGFTGLLV
jgi:hypothetical protein